MVLYIDNTFGGYLEEHELTLPEQVFFSGLANSYYEGKCYLCGDVRSLEWLVKKLGTPANEVFKIALSRYAEDASMIQYVEMIFSLSLTVGEDARQAVPERFRAKATCLSLAEAMQINWSNGCCLVAENTIDCNFYKYVAQKYCQEKGLQAVHTSFHHEMGGGSETAVVLQKCVGQDHLPVLCVVDSDHKYGRIGGNLPPFGDTCTRVRRKETELKKTGNEKTFSVFVIQAHEIENLIPLSVLQKLDLQICPTEGIEILQELVKINDGIPILYYDFKKGVQTTGDTPRAQYWRGIFSEVNEDVKDTYVKIGSEKLLEATVKFFDEYGVGMLEVDDHLRQIWNELGSMIFTWGCAAPPLRAS